MKGESSGGGDGDSDGGGGGGGERQRQAEAEQHERCSRRDGLSAEGETSIRRGCGERRKEQPVRSLLVFGRSPLNYEGGENANSGCSTARAS